MTAIRKIVVAGALVAALGVAACATTTPQGDEAKGLYVAEAAFDGATLAAEQAVKAGLLKGSSAQVAEAYLTKAHTALLAARAAYTAGNATDLTTQLSAVTTAVSEVESLAKGN